MEWYDGILDGLSPPPEQANANSAVQMTDDSSFPMLSSVPDQVPEVSQQEERRQIVEDLVAERIRAEYADEEARSATAPPTPTSSTGVAVVGEATETAAVAPPPPSPADVPGSGTAAGRMTAVEVFNRKLAASSSTVTTAPAHIDFAPSAAQPLTNLPASVPAVVRNTYNESLARSAVVTAAEATSAGLTTTSAMPQTGAREPLVVKFPRGSAGLSPRDRRALKALAQAFKEQGGTIRVVGHASSRTRDMTTERHQLVNFWISADRARAVADELMRQGASSAAILVEARANSLPLSSESMPAGEAENRRAEVFLGF